MEDKVMYTYYLMLDGEKVIGFNKAFGIVYETETEIINWFTEDGMPLYKYVDGEVLERTEAEIEADRETPLVEPTLEERINDLEIALCEVVDALTM